MVGRTEWLTLELEKIGTTIVIVPDDANIYDVPEYSHLKDTMTDGKERLTIPGTPNKPIIVTRKGDVLRTRGSDRFEMIHDFAKLYLEVGIKKGAPAIPRGPRDSDEQYDFYGHIKAAYENSKAKNLWPGTKMMESLEDYFAEATMVYWEVTPEYQTWTEDGGPVNTRLELKAYDRQLWNALVEVYPEFEYICAYSTSKTGTPILPPMAFTKANNPWYKNSQKNVYDINGNLYPPLAIVEANLIDPTRLELIFNRDVAYDFESEATNASNYTISWTYLGDGAGQNIANFTKNAVGPYQFNRVTFNLNATQVTSADLYDGEIGQGIRGFTQADLDASPWVKNGLAALENGGRPREARSPDIYAIKRGTFVGPEDMANDFNGTMTVTVTNPTVIKDWSGNSVAATPIEVELKPWFNQVYRTPVRGVYVYGDRDVQPSSLEMAATYIDAILANTNTNTDPNSPIGEIGQRMADGITASNGGMSIIAYDNHAYLQPTGRNSQGPNMHYYLYVEGFGGNIAQTTEFNLLRDIARTKYRNEFILGHEFCHSIQGSVSQGMGVYLYPLYLKTQQRYTDSGGSTGIWHNTYPGSNAAEFFASLSTLWFSTMRESADGTHNNTWYPQNTREELYRYDPGAYALWKEMFYEGGISDPDDEVKNKGVPGLVGTPWESHSTPNIYDVDGSLYNPPAVPFGTEVRMESDDGSIGALIAVVDKSGKSVKVDAVKSNLANSKAFALLIEHGVGVLDVVDGKLEIQGNVDEPFEVALVLSVYTPSATDGSPTDQRDEEIILRFLPMEKEKDETTPNNMPVSGGGGCNTGAAVLAILAVLPFVIRKKDNFLK
jgi:Synergist-CTERM protein sorting domain-containing protein